MDFLNKKTKDKPLLVIGWLILLLYCSVAFTDDNHVHVEQVTGGDNADLNIDQIGYNNLVNFSFDHQNNTIDLIQTGNNMYFGYTDTWGSGKAWGGDIDGYNNEIDARQRCSDSSCNDNDIGLHVWGNHNKVVFGQGYEINNSLTPTWDYDGLEPGGNYLRLDIHGDYNEFKGSQKQDNNTIEHRMIWNIYGDYNDVFSKQLQNGNKTLTGTINNDSNEVAVVQKKTGAHTATITIDGTYPTDLSLTQTGSIAQTYSLTQNCITVGGCSVSVTQGN